MNIKVKIDGVEEVVTNLNMINNDIRNKVQKELVIAGINVLNGARKRCPVDTGALRNSISTKKIGDLEVETGAYMPYAAFVEYGTSKMKAQPFLFPAYEEEKPKFLKRLKRIVGSD